MVPPHYLQIQGSFDYCSGKDDGVEHGARIQIHDMVNAHIRAQIGDEPYLKDKDVTIDHGHYP